MTRFLLGALLLGACGGQVEPAPDLSGDFVAIGTLRTPLDGSGCFSSFRAEGPFGSVGPLYAPGMACEVTRSGSDFAAECASPSSTVSIVGTIHDLRRTEQITIRSSGGWCSAEFSVQILPIEEAALAGE
jgi:hypothetical protein